MSGSAYIPIVSILHAFQVLFRQIRNLASATTLRFTRYEQCASVTKKPGIG